MKRSLAEAGGTFVLSFGGCGSAVLAGTRWVSRGVARLWTLAVGQGAREPGWKNAQTRCMTVWT